MYKRDRYSNTCKRFLQVRILLEALKLFVKLKTEDHDHSGSFRT